MTRKQTILFFADYIHTIAMTYEKKKYRLLVEVDKRFMPADIKKVADKKGLSVVVDKNTVVYGGLDITDEVSKALQSGK